MNKHKNIIKQDWLMHMRNIQYREIPKLQIKTSPLKVVVWCNLRKMPFFIKSNISKKVIKIHGYIFYKIIYRYVGSKKCIFGA